MLQSAADIASMYAALGEPVTPAAGAVFNGIFDCADVSTFDGAAQVGDHALQYPTSVGSFVLGATLEIRGQQYTVVVPSRRIRDGLESVVELVEAA